MKKSSFTIIIMVLLTMMAVPAQAKRVSESVARRIAEQFLEIDYTTRTGNRSLTLVWNGLDNVSTKADAADTGDRQAPFYVFNRQDGGFVIVAGDDRSQPILAYSEKSSFSHTEMPDNVAMWTDRMISHMENIISGNIAVPDNTEQWKNLEGITKALGSAQKVLTTAQWGQSGVFSDYCSTQLSTSVVTGCSATAAAILMRYFKYPSKAHGPIEEYTTKTQGYMIHAQSTDNLQNYDWDNMPLVNDGKWTQHQKEQVSKLLYDCGTAFEADYGINATNAFNDKMLNGMIDHMKFSRKARMINRSDFGLTEWLELIEEQIDSEIPLIYLGQSSFNNGGHAFIIDGFDSNGYLHVNWGWSGTNNGFYAMTDIEYNTSDIILIGLVPDSNWTEEALPQLSIRNDRQSFTTSIPYIEKNDEFTAKCTFWNDGTVSFKGRVYLKLFSNNGTVKETLYSNTLDILNTYLSTFSTGTISISSDIEEGDYLAWTYETSIGDVEIYNNRYCRKQLRYSLASEVELSFNKKDKTIKLDGMNGMTCQFQGSTYTFKSDDSLINGNVLIIKLQEGTSGTFPLIISNGKETITVNLSF